MAERGLIWIRYDQALTPMFVSILHQHSSQAPSYRLIYGRLRGRCPAPQPRICPHHAIGTTVARSITSAERFVT